MWQDSVVPLFQAHSVSVFFAGFLALIILSGLGLGFIRITLNLRDKKKTHVSQLFGSFHLVPKLIVAGFIALVVITIGLALFIIPGIFLITRLFFFKAYIVDKDAGVIESLKKSYNATRGLEWEVLGLFIVMLMLMAIPVIGFPVGTLMFVDSYRKLQK
ncbi:unnamed protein product [marine sediment metagenome]|uniref:DUF7847 domain-containing protein n=1 Tax=marine sediment metagenome TaxID=412755 RepID=X1C608_9ZZZZ